MNQPDTQTIRSQLLIGWLLAAGMVLVIAHCLWPLPAQAQTPDPARRVFAPYFEDKVIFAQSTILWFGQVNSASNYADVRVGYNDEEIVLYLQIFDRWLWYDTTPATEDLTAWDAVTLYLSLEGDMGETPGPNTHRFVAQLSNWEDREDYQATYRGDGSDWVAAATSFASKAGWRGNGLNDGSEARGWWAILGIPFASLGLSAPPPPGSAWGLALALHDRDDQAGVTAIPDQTWPEAMEAQRPVTWGQLVFGLPTYHQPFASPGEVVTIRHELNGASVVDGHVGGHSICGTGLDFWTEWADANYEGYTQINIQSQRDVADWPCFSKYYITFPLDSIPEGKAIISATLRLYQFGNAGQGYDPGPQPSVVQVLTVAEDWDEATLTWNNAPLALENVSAAWIDPLDAPPGWPGVARGWDVSQAVAEAYTKGDDQLRLVLYEADEALHSGKYFYSSDAGQAARPTLQVLWGTHLTVIDGIYLPLILKR